jgi:hypothetical protein
MSILFQGAFAGAFAVGCTYPLDTVKTRIQSGNITRLYKNLFSGISVPMVAVALEKSILFASFKYLSKIKWTYNDNTNNFINGINSGLLTTSVVTPFERIKIMMQNKNALVHPYNVLMHILKTEGPIGLYRGWTATLFREVPGYGFYFTTLLYCQKRWPVSENMKSNIVKQWFIGGLTGFVPWIFIYPADIVKTTMQEKNWIMRYSIKYIYDRGGVRAFYNGYIYGLARAFFLHSFVILGLHLSNNLSNNLLYNS